MKVNKAELTTKLDTLRKKRSCDRDKGIQMSDCKEV